MSTVLRGRDELARSLVRALRKLRAEEDRERRTILTREIAELTVDLRAHFLTADGRPDWTARAWATRGFVRDRYLEAGYSSEEARSVQAAVRYHVGNLVRARLDAEELDDLGLRAASPADRSREQREIRSALVQAVGATQGEHDVSRALANVYVILQRVEPGSVAALAAEERRQGAALLRRIGARAEGLSEATAGMT